MQDLVYWYVLTFLCTYDEIELFKRKKKYVLNHAVDFYNLLNLSIIWTDISIYAIARYLGHVSLLITQRFESGNLLECTMK